jgi:hypothetical protein
LNAWWKFWEKGDKEGEEGEEPTEFANVERILGVRFEKDEQDRIVGVEYKLRWEDANEDSWCAYS